MARSRQRKLQLQSGVGGLGGQEVDEHLVGRQDGEEMAEAPSADRVEFISQYQSTAREALMALAKIKRVPFPASQSRARRVIQKQGKRWTTTFRKMGKKVGR